MLVDDEKMTREGLKEFIAWDRFDMQVVGMAENGRQALERFGELTPDLLVCDVRMPHMDGLELARSLKDKAPACKFIFLSGYTDVDYLKTAIKLQAVDYVEKPVQIPELEELLERTGEDIRRAREESLRAKRIRESWDTSRPEVAGKVIRRLVSPTARSGPEWERTLGELAMLNPSFPSAGTWVCCAAVFADAVAREAWSREAAKEAAVHGLTVLAAVVDGRGVAMAALESERRLEPLTLWLNRMVSLGRQEGDAGAAVSAGVGSVIHSLAQAEESYEEAVNALQYKFYRGWGSVLWHRELPGTRRDDLLLFNKEHLKRFEEALRRNDFAEAEEGLGQAVDELLGHPVGDVESVRKKLFFWYVSMTKISPEAMWEVENDELWSNVFVAGELHTVRQFMARRLEIIKESLGEKAPVERSVIRDVLKYIHQHYDADITIAAIAGHVYLTPTYLCLLFKKDRGVSINDYITSYRIEKAKALLRERGLKLYEIARMVGYQDANYFSKVFRKLTGVNPSEYRDTLEEYG
ncbi:response regulator [Paenibacillus aurantius]|uniref:Response regulator n=1 Tax=Paenibacillus aurantius TaxID=2918900 RepID=A0AA96LGD5_9BACL|nr:response regulator [Paenibacillus aurantius]WNQ12739.1 response regulator [Paenibacillus aurantius]